MSDGSWILGENGTFVNCLKEDIRIEGKKIWGNVPRGFDKAVLRKATFTFYQKLEEETIEWRGTMENVWIQCDINVWVQSKTTKKAENLFRILGFAFSV